MIKASTTKNNKLNTNFYLTQVYLFIRVWWLEFYLVLFEKLAVWYMW